MRPLTLTIEGLRSFRSAVEISFQDRDHLAIIGDTGAGKSSILEAMTYALFGRTTFTGHANQEIINDLADHMRVTLRFTVAGRTFEVTRALRRASDRTVGAAKASLTEFGPDGTEIYKIEQVRQVNDHIKEALGLDADAFLRTVILPQGQFAQLLVGDDPAARAAILRQVWRTDELTRAGQLADEALPELSELVGQVTQALEGAPENPAAHLQQLRADAEQRLAAAKRARDTHRAAVTARDSLKEAEQTTRATENVLEKTRDFDFPAATATAEEVVRAAAAIAAERATAEGQQKALREQLQAVPSDDDGLDHQAIGAARATLDGLPARARAAVNAAARARAEAVRAEVAERRAGELEEKLQGLDRQLNERQDTRQDLAATLTGADTKLRESQTLLRDVRQDATDAERRQAQALTKARQAGLVQQEMAQLQERDLAEASQRARTAEEAYADAQRSNSAAAAAHGLNPGDDCSVCNRPLPPDWQPPVAEGLSAARDAQQAAEAKLTEMQGKIRDLATRAEIIRNQATELQQEAEDSRDTATTAAARLAALLGRDEIDLVTLPQGDEPLQPLASALAQAREALDVHDAESQQLRERRAAEQANLDNAQGSLDKSTAARSESLDEARDTVRALRTALASLPQQLRVSAVLPDDPLGLEKVLLTGLDAAYQVLGERAQELDRRADRRKHLQQQLNEAADSIRDLDERWTDQVLSPGDGLVKTVNSNRDNLSEGITLLNIRDVPLPPAASMNNPAGLVDTVRAFRETADKVTRRTRSMMEAARMEAQAARQTIAQLTTEFTMPATALHPAGPDEVVACAADQAAEEDAEARVAKQTTDAFARLVAPLTRLRQGGEELTLVYKVLKDLSAALKPGAFPKWLTLRRSRALLVHASRLLEQMSGERYAFAELGDENAEWRVVDNDSGLARSPASLSGGEQFIASLALALGMVEMMARSGGRLESLWLDEGFGSLDRTNLDAAIEALESVAARGRMVAVISHVRAVADQVSHVLAVTREITGSRANWLDPSQRAQLATSDLEGESALSGLLE